MKKLLFIIIGYSLLLAGCGENEAIYYEGESDSTSGIYFAYYTSTTREGASVIYNYAIPLAITPWPPWWENMHR